ncbi:hypothetical protein P171DRAFT_40888 [Karstenula rhodostoma CBS 690.94]|uniref:Uncharacterized protein n=1 Tax=Karstenula rhodostoma CBS 690.94 TaxID=1392251 RepID=A0A9P4PEJ9_9PLEO|nr:hypothetical protein P171DRAFT_40888 [Karstenula rhodostoma CBS 690.94]
MARLQGGALSAEEAPQATQACQARSAENNRLSILGVGGRQFTNRIASLVNVVDQNGMLHWGRRRTQAAFASTREHRPRRSRARTLHAPCSLGFRAPRKDACQCRCMCSLWFPSRCAVPVPGSSPLAVPEHSCACLSLPSFIQDSFAFLTGVAI